MKNIFTKSMMRQPVRTLLLALLMAVAAFSFVMRSMEYIVISEQIHEIGSFFRPIGILGYLGDDLDMPDVRPAAQIVSGSPYVRFDDRRSNFEVVLLDTLNTGSLDDNGRMIGRSYLHPKDAFFYGTLSDIRRDGINPYIVLSVEVDMVLLGYPEHVSEGQTLDAHYFLDQDEIQTGISAIDDMETGKRYFLRGVYYNSWTARESGSPQIYKDLFVLHPLNEETYDGHLSRERSIPRDGVWYVPAPTDKPLDLTIPKLEGLYDELHWLRYGQSSIRLQATVDMSYTPFMQPRRAGPWRGVLVEGRWVSVEDNEQMRPVVAINENFASRRGLVLGDTLRIGIPPGHPEYQSANAYHTYGFPFGVTSGLGDVFAPFAHILELEIVGIFGITDTSGTLINHYDGEYLYIPDSVLPPDIVMKDFEWPDRSGDEVIFVTKEEGFFDFRCYSFVLNDARDADAFLLENREALEEVGFYIEFLPGVAGAQAFWDSADMILQTIRFNLVLFFIVSVLILVVAVFLYIRQRHRDYAILRALGNPKLRTNRQLITTLLLVALPAVILGGAGGWLIALNEVVKSLGSLPGIQQAEVDMLWLPLLIAAVLVGLLLLALTGIIIRRRPVLEMLQGTAAKRGKK